MLWTDVAIRNRLRFTEYNSLSIIKYLVIHCYLMGDMTNRIVFQIKQPHNKILQ